MTVIFGHDVRSKLACAPVVPVDGPCPNKMIPGTSPGTGHVGNEADDA
jgi:hypothetical protein